MLDAGAVSVRAIASHCVMSDPASERVQDSSLTEMVFTDSIPYTHKCAKVKQLTIPIYLQRQFAGLLAMNQ